MSRDHTGGSVVAAGPGRGRRWVDREIETLDPQTDYARIINLVAEYKLNEFVLNLAYTVGFMSNIMPAPGSQVTHATGKLERVKQTRYLDTVDFFREWYFKGPSHPDVRESLTRLNRRHAHLAKTHPDSFTENDDWIFPVANMACGADRMRDLVGAPRQSPTVQIALHHFWRDIFVQLEGMSGPVHSWPADYDAVLAFVEEFENREYPSAPAGRLVCEALIAQFNERFLPRALHPAGRTLILALTPPAVRTRHGLKPPNRAGAALARRAFRLIFAAQDRFLPDPKIPYSQVVASPKYQTWRTTVRQQEKTS